jgi:hypothetical protein
MGLDTYILIVWSIMMTYCIVGLYVHSTKILPKLRESQEKVHFPLMPSEFLRQVDEYLIILDATGERPWFYLYLRYIRVIILVLLLSMMPIFLQDFGVPVFRREEAF